MHADNGELSICTTDDSRTGEMPISFMCACVKFTKHATFISKLENLYGKHLGTDHVTLNNDENSLANSMIEN